MRERADEITSFARTARSGVSRGALLGMGGSSLAPETFASTRGGGVPLTVLDTTDPGHIAHVRSTIDPDSTLFVVSSKSGTTVETNALFDYFWSIVPRGDRFVAITDPGTPLAHLGAERGFRRVFENPPDIGGRYSALSYFGLVPAALCGIDVAALLETAQHMMTACGPSVVPRHSPAMRLAGGIGDALGEDRDKLTL